MIRIWYQSKLHFFAFLLVPCAWLFAAIVWVRKLLYRLNILKIERLSLPVIVVGNITVGGTGKTPMVIWLTKFLQAQGFNPGIISRGVGGKKQLRPRVVNRNDAVKEVGDEALLLVQQTNCPLVICIDRAKAGAYLQAHFPCDVLISDDGLQHYRLARDIEIVMIDGARQFGNCQLLPAGPLRESISRLKSADFLVVNGENKLQEKLPASHKLSLTPDRIISLVNPKQQFSLSTFPYETYHAVCGIGHPEQFFAGLQKSGADIKTHIFPDHYLYQPQDLDFQDQLPIVMTAKDAVKCLDFASDHYWVVSVAVEVDPQFGQDLLSKLQTSETKPRLLA